MGIGGAIFLIAVGAIIAFGVDADIGWLELNVVGWVLMLAGVAGLILTLWFWQNRRRTAVHPVPVEDDRTVVDEHGVIHDRGAAVEERYHYRNTAR